METSRYSYCFFLALLLALPLACGKTESHLETAKVLTREKSFDEALVEYSKAIESDKESAEAYYGRGMVYFEQEKLEEAARDFRKAIDIKTDFLDAHKMLAKTFTEIGAPPDQFTQRLIRIQEEPDNAMSYVDMGVFQHKLEQDLDAIENYKRALELDPKNSYILYNLGVGYLDMGLYEDAEAIFKESLEIEPDYDKAHYNLAFSYHKQGRIDETIKELNTTLEVNPQYSDCYVVFGLISLREKKFEEAIGHYNKALEINPDNLEARYQRAIVFALQQRYDEALAENMAILEKDPKFANAAYNIGVIYHRTDRLDKAMEWYNKLIWKIDKLYEDAYYNRAQLYSMKEDHSKAYNDYMIYCKINKFKTGLDPAVVYNEDEIKEMFLSDVPTLEGQKDLEVDLKTN
ncbi:MAG: tetratricopeptide repeat protein [Candidatus Brocadiaceae bacterium]|nr:tetratricopeptide repeat protein [Candidatus Brocadiaceae bacterium]